MATFLEVIILDYRLGGRTVITRGNALKFAMDLLYQILIPSSKFDALGSPCAPRLFNRIDGEGIDNVCVFKHKQI